MRKSNRDPVQLELPLDHTGCYTRRAEKIKAPLLDIEQPSIFSTDDITRFEVGDDFSISIGADE